MAGELSEKGGAWVPLTPEKSVPARFEIESTDKGLNHDVGSVGNHQSSRFWEKESGNCGFEFGICGSDKEVGQNCNGSDARSSQETIEVEAPFARERESQLHNKNLCSEFGHYSTRASNTPKNQTPKKRSNKSTDSDKKPRKRMKMKRHRPKVFDETKPIKPKTPKPCTPKRATNVKKKDRPKRRAPLDHSKDVDREAVDDSIESSCRQKLNFDTESCIMNQNTKCCDWTTNEPEVEPKELQSASRLSCLIVYQRRFRPNECLKNSRKLGPNCPKVFKKRRTRRKRATVFDKFITLVSMIPSTRKQRMEAMDEPLKLNQKVKNRKKKSPRSKQRKKSVFAKKRAKKVIIRPRIEKCMLNLTWMVNLKRKRSKRSTRRWDYTSFIDDISEIHFSEDFLLRASRIRTQDTENDKVIPSVGVQDYEDFRHLGTQESIEQREVPQKCPVEFGDYTLGVEADNLEKLLEVDTLGTQESIVQQEVSQECPTKAGDYMVGVETDIPEKNLGTDTFFDNFIRQFPEYFLPKEVESNFVTPYSVGLYHERKDVRDSDVFIKALVDFTVQRMEGLRIDDDGRKQLVVRDKNARGELVPSKGKFDPSKKRKAWPKVDLDAETIRVWNLLMENGESRDTEQEDEEKAKYWKEQRKIFDGRLDSFIARMNLIQGDRRFSPWKGSVVDSVAGVFLTQNVSDHLSSSAFMALVAKFPPLCLSEHTSTSSNRPDHARDSVNWEAVRQAPVGVVAEVIMERGMNNILAGRIKDFLDRLVRDHGSIDLEWLRDVPPDHAKEYLLSIPGLGLKSVECVRLLALHHHAFPVDTNVGRILVRLGWVPLQPLPEDVQIHLLNQYPMLDTIQKYVWPRLCHRVQQILYEIHYHMITFGKAFCTKRQPNCNACPMRGECRHFASAFASARLRLEGTRGENKETESSVSSSLNSSPPKLPYFDGRDCEPIVEIPASPEPLCVDIEDFCCNQSDDEINVVISPNNSCGEDLGCESDDDIPTIKLNSEEFAKNVLSFVDREHDMSKALVCLHPEAASIPAPKLKIVGRLRTLHHVYELPDSHPLLAGFEKREPDDPCPYLLAIWTTDETATSSQEAKRPCGCQEPAKCDMCTLSCSGQIVECQNDQTVRGTILIPCRTANRGSFPLNGTYFQVNEVFADHESSHRPISVSTSWIWNLRRRALYCGTSTTSISRGLSLEEIQYCFRKGFICVRGFDKIQRAAKPLARRFHLCKTRQVDDDS